MILIKQATVSTKITKAMTVLESFPGFSPPFPPLVFFFHQLITWYPFLLRARATMTLPHERGRWFEGTRQGMS